MGKELLKKTNIFLILFFAFGLIVYGALNGGAYGRQLKYAIFINLPFLGNDLRANDILEVREATASVPDGGYQLFIPKIDVSAPIVIPLGTSNKAVLASLEEGVGLYPGSAALGTPESRSIILGHSSRASWYRGEYATIFALLPKLEPLDEFYIIGNGKKYVYNVFSKQILSPKAANELFTGPSSGSEIDLITCYPIGSASSRTVIRASLVRVENI